MDETGVLEQIFTASGLTPTGPIAKALGCIILLVALLWLLDEGVKHCAGLLNTLRRLDLSLLPHPDTVVEWRRRRQFASVLVSDIAQLSKAEAWNDQYFTDIEADIETSGRFFPNILARIARKPQRGLRHEASLVGALQHAADTKLLVLGEPGSGKTVALRHLAIQLANDSGKRKNKKTPVPLYINLREVPNWDDADVDLDRLRQFIRDHVRRGDVDTADFIEQRWNAKCQEGTWVFLFDSFDEIPAVLHAGTGSHTVATYSNAIRRFAAHVHPCPVIVASREFKAPALEWTRLRILPLKPNRQYALVRNSFLPDNIKAEVLRELAISSTTITRSPMFLSLICRHANETGKFPTSEIDLIGQHVKRLADRDPSYTRRTFGLGPDSLIDGASRLARLVAESPHIGLSPTISQLVTEFSHIDIQYNAEQLIKALLYVKILRTDLPSHDPSECRVAFGHRRYQEALYARYISRNLSHSQPRRLLQDVLLHEYTITALQSQTVTQLQPLFDEAVRLLEGTILERKPVEASFGAGLSYYEANEEAFSLLRLLEAGLARRRGDIPKRLSRSITSVLRTIWDRGDLVDRRRVLSVCSLLEDGPLSSIIREALSLGVGDLEELAFERTQSLKTVPKDIGYWIGRRLALETLSAVSEADELRVDALLNKLPASKELVGIVRSCRSIRGVTKRMSWAFPVMSKWDRVPRFASLLIARDKHEWLLRRHRAGVHAGYFTSVVLFLAATATGAEVSQRITASVPGWEALSLATVLLATSSALIGSRTMLRQATTSLAQLRQILLFIRTAVTPDRLRRAFGLLLAYFIFLVPPITVFALREIWPTLSIGWALAGHIAWSFTLMAIANTIETQLTKKSLIRLQRIRATGWCPLPVSLHARDGRELQTWITESDPSILRNIVEMRSLSRYLLSGQVPIKRSTSSCQHGLVNTQLPATLETLGAVGQTILDTLDGMKHDDLQASHEIDNTSTSEARQWPS